MALHKIPLLAGREYRLDAIGKNLLVDDIGVAAALDITVIRAGQAMALPGRKPGFRYQADFDALILKTDVDATVMVFASFDPVNMVPGATRVSSAPNDPVFVSFSQQIVPLGSVEVSNTDAKAVPVVQKAGAAFTVQEKAMPTIVDAAPVVVGLARGALSSDATLRRLRVRNGHATATVAIGGAGVTLANAVIVLGPGCMWTEDDAAGAAWFAISDTAGVSVQLQGLK